MWRRVCVSWLHPAVVSQLNPDFSLLTKTRWRAIRVRIWGDRRQCCVFTDQTECWWRTKIFCGTVESSRRPWRAEQQTLSWPGVTKTPCDQRTHRVHTDCSSTTYRTDWGQWHHIQLLQGLSHLIITSSSLISSASLRRPWKYFPAYKQTFQYGWLWTVSNIAASQWENPSRIIKDTKTCNKQRNRKLDNVLQIKYPLFQ